jgi:hypothetical protein
VRKTFPPAALASVAAFILLSPAAQLEAQPESLKKHFAGVDTYSSSALPAEPAPAAELYEPGDPMAGSRERPFVPPGMEEHYGMLSRVSVGSSISPFGIGANGAVILNEHADARVDTGWLFYNTGRVEISGVNAVGDFHLASMAAKVDWYPTRSVWRLSPGVLLYNGNQVTATLALRGGTNFSLNGTNYWSANANPVTGATPLGGNVKLGLHRQTPAFTVSGGFGRYVPHSHRHWSFPTEFGVAFTGAPTLDVKVSGWACRDKQQTQCSNIADPANPVGLEFQQNLNTALTKWRHDLSAVHIYPILSTAFMYSFDLPGSR